MRLEIKKHSEKINIFFSKGAFCQNFADQGLSKCLIYTFKLMIPKSFG
jgi:hypothetical protein